MSRTLLLASASPRRRELLERFGVEVRVRPIDFDEARIVDHDPVRLAERLATAKASWAAVLPDVLDEDLPALAADTVVWTPEGELLGKPVDVADACRMIASLAGRVHHVTTGWTLFFPAQRRILPARSETTRVRFFPLTRAEIEAYVAVGESHDKAGAYGIQGQGAALVEGIEGSYTNVVGLPVERVLRQVVTECAWPALWGEQAW